MNRLTETKILLVVRATRLAELKARFATKAQARFYVERLGGDFGDCEREDATYQEAIRRARQTLGELGRVQLVQRSFLPNFVFGARDVVVALGQDGLVANTLKYLDGQPLVGVNPDPQRYDGQLLPFHVANLDTVMREVLRGGRRKREVTMAEASLNTIPAMSARVRHDHLKNPVGRPGSIHGGNRSRVFEEVFDRKPFYLWHCSNIDL